MFSIGELHNATLLARNMENAGVKTRFLASEERLSYIRACGLDAYGMRRQTRQTAVISEHVNTFRPHAIILADYHNLDLEPPLIELDTLSNVRVPVATIDSLAFAPEAKRLENAFFTDDLPGNRMLRGTTLREVPDFMKIIRTCPLNGPVDIGSRIKAVRLYDRPIEIDSRVRQSVRSRFGCVADGHKLVVFAKAAWAHLPVKMRLMKKAQSSTGIPYFYEDFLRDSLSTYLSDCCEKVVVVGVSPEKCFHTGTLGQLDFVNLPFLDFVRYQELLMSSDLFVSDNITSASLAKAMFGHVPGIALINSSVSSANLHTIVSNELSAIVHRWHDYIGAIYPFYVYPNGWISELETLMSGNPYFDVLNKVEMFDHEKAQSAFSQLLYDESAIQRNREQQAAYMDTVFRIRGANELAEWLAER